MNEVSVKTTRYFLWQLVRAERVGKRSGDIGGFEWEGGGGGVGVAGVLTPRF